MKKFLDCISVVGTTPSRFQGTKKYVSTGAVATTEIDESEVVEVSYEDRPSRANLSAEAGDILFAKMQGTRKTLLLDSETEEHIYSTGFYAVRANPEVITTECLYYLVDSELFLTQKDKHCSGATQKAITNGGLAKIEIRVPPLSEQGVLTEKLRYLTQLIADKRKQLELFDEVKKSRFIEMFGEPESNPMHWEMLPLENCLTVLGGYAFKSEEFKASGIPVLRIGNINTGVFTPTNMVYWAKDVSLERYQVLPGDLVISLTGTVGKDDYGNVCILGNAYPLYYLNQRNAKLNLGESLNKHYLSELLKFSQIKKKLTGISRGVRQANISNRDILNLVVPIPPIELQDQYAAFVEQTDKSKFEIQQSLEKLETLKKALMQKYFG